MRFCKLLLIPIGILPLALFIAIARYRFIDPDEGFYLLASRLVFEHKLPYVDFFYTQTPLFPYVYGFWAYLTGESFFTARLFSVGLTSAIGILIYLQVHKYTKKPSMASLAVLLFATNSLVFGWMPIAKTYAFSSLLLFASYVVLTGSYSRSSKLVFGAAGILFGLSVEVRLYFAGVLPVLLIYILRNLEIRAKKIAVYSFLAGFVIAMLPSFYLFAISPQSYLFNNLGYHAFRSGHGLVGDLGQKLSIFFGAIMFPAPGNGPQLGLLCIIGPIATWKTRTITHWPLTFQLAAALGVISLLPTPTYIQYLCVLIPFVVVGTICALDDLLGLIGHKRAPALAVVGFALLAMYVNVSIKEYRRFVLTGSGFGKAGEGAANWNPKMVNAVSKTVDQLATPGEQVMSFWPGYLVSSRAAQFPGFENDSGLACSGRLTLAQLSKYHIASSSQTRSEIAAHVPRIVVLGNQEYLHLHKRPYAEALLHAGYHVVAVIGDTSIYTL